MYIYVPFGDGFADHFYGNIRDGLWHGIYYIRSSLRILKPAKFSTESLENVNGNNHGCLKHLTEVHGGASTSRTLEARCKQCNWRQRQRLEQ